MRQFLIELFDEQSVREAEMQPYSSQTIRLEREPYTMHAFCSSHEACFGGHLARRRWMESHPNEGWKGRPAKMPSCLTLRDMAQFSDLGAKIGKHQLHELFEMLTGANDDGVFLMPDNRSEWLRQRVYLRDYGDRVEIAIPDAPVGLMAIRREQP